MQRNPAIVAAAVWKTDADSASLPELSILGAVALPAARLQGRVFILVYGGLHIRETITGSFPGWAPWWAAFHAFWLLPTALAATPRRGRPGSLRSYLGLAAGVELFFTGIAAATFDVRYLTAVVLCLGAILAVAAMARRDPRVQRRRRRERVRAGN